MTLNQIINHSIPTLQPHDTVDDALILMNDLKFSFLPLINLGQLEGFYSEDLLLNYDSNLKLSEILPLPAEAVLIESDPLLEAIRKSATTDIPLIPVINQEEDYVGCIEKVNLYESFIGDLSVNEVGGIIEIQLKNEDYSLAEIARIAESESCKIISLFINRDPNLDFVLTLKLDKSQISRVIQALERYGYNVLSYHSSEPVTNYEKDRFEQLMKYLSI